MEVKVDKNAKYWLINKDGSGMPLTRFLTDRELLEDVDETYDQAYPTYKTNQKAKTQYTIYKSRSNS